MRDIVPQPKKPTVPEPLLAAPPIEPLLEAPLPVLELPEHRPAPKKKRMIWVVVVLAAIILIVASVLTWYNLSLAARGGTLKQLVIIKVPTGSTTSDIGRVLHDKAVIQDPFAFEVYTWISGNREKLKAGTYRLSPAETVPQIVEHLVKGTVDEFSITFLPGATLAENRQVLLDADYTEAEIDAAFNAQYNTSLFAGRPAAGDLEGYIYGETYYFNTGASVSEVLQRAFDQFASVVSSNHLEAGFQAHGLSLYQGITLASIIQREVHKPADQQQVAQIFYLRLASGMPLGSDVTYIYAAKKLGVTASPSLDLPYNTRKYAGLPPGPIATPGLTALQAVANPASGNYVYFLSGDDGTTYYARTDAQHQANIAAHCQVKCSQ